MPVIVSHVRRHVSRVRASVVAAVAVGAVAGAFAACGPDTSEVRVSPDDRAQLADGTRFADSLATATKWDDAGVIALGYLERLRLGLGSPFRLAEQAAGDPRLPGVAGRRTAYALLAATLRGQLFAVDSAALGAPADHLAPGAQPDGGWHRALIDSAVRAATTPRTGEEAVRIAYALAKAEGLVTARMAQSAVHAAALIRDRRLAVRDVERLLEAAQQVKLTRVGVDALGLLREWRVERRFASEQPLLADALAPSAPEAVRAAEALLGRMRQEGVIVRDVALTLPLASDSGAVDSTRADSAATLLAPPVVAGTAPTITATPAARRDALGALPVAAAQRLAALPSARAAYPSAPVVVTLGGFRHTVPTDTVATGDSTAVLKRLRARLATRARTEELLAAEWAIVQAELPPAARRELTALVQSAAVAVRPWAQAPAVGVAAGTVATAAQTAGATAELDALRARDGYRSVAFERGTPAAWRPVAARQLGDAVADLRGVFSNLTLDGLAVRVGETPRRELALALHEPATRTVYLPPATGAGTVAHELVHDLDWQIAHSPRLATRAGYGTDHLARTDTGTLAQAVRGLGGSRAATRRALGAAAPGTNPMDGERPAERLARGADFFVAAALARDGRSNGVLSVVQDASLTGYAGVVAPEPGDGAAESLVEVLGSMTAIPPATRAWYLARFGAAGTRSPLAVAQFALGAPMPWGSERLLRAAGVPGGLAGPVNPGFASACGGIGGGAAAPWQARLVWLAADARARGILRSRAAIAAVAGRTSWGWTARGVIGGPWDPAAADSTVARARDGVLRAAMGEARRAAGVCAVAGAPAR